MSSAVAWSIEQSSAAGNVLYVLFCTLELCIRAAGLEPAIQTSLGDLIVEYSSQMVRSS
jgi:hypothetical protein